MWMPARLPDDLLHGRFLILRRGKRTVGAVEFKRSQRTCSEGTSIDGTTGVWESRAVKLYAK